MGTKAKMKLTVHFPEQIKASEWDTFIQNSPQGGPFLYYSWISCVQVGWEYLEIRDQEKLIARMPIGPKRKLFLSYALQPLFCQHWGLCFIPGVTQQQMEDSFAVILPYLENRFSILSYNFSPNLPVFTGLVSKGWKMKKRITHWANLELDPYLEFSDAARRQVKKSERGGYSIEEKLDNTAFENLVKQNPTLMNSTQLQLFKRLLDGQEQEGRIIQLMGKNTEGEIVAGGIFIPYMERLYYLAGAVSPEHRNSGVMSALLLAAMRKGKAAGLRLFDFEGSMNPGIARFFKGLGGKEKEYICFEYQRYSLPQLWKKF
jgi:GNAT superfamily N-acetyltransferase